jgi:hypothetical protein
LDNFRYNTVHSNSQKYTAYTVVIKFKAQSVIARLTHILYLSPEQHGETLEREGIGSLLNLTPSGSHCYAETPRCRRWGRRRWRFSLPGMYCILHIILYEGNIPDTRKQEIISTNFSNWLLVKKGHFKEGFKVIFE